MTKQISRETISTEHAPQAIGTYSQAVKTNAATTVYISGQIPLVPQTMELVSTDFTAQAKQVFENLSAVATEAGGGLADCVKLTVYLIDLDQFAQLNEVMAAYMEAPYPARAAVQVSALPKGAQIEIDAVMCLG